MTAASTVGVRRTKAHEMARSGTFPVRLLKIGNRYRVPTADLCEYLGIRIDADDAAPAA
ncbi:helix-turn-helix domain-containing protein [Saccharothrix sp. NRRL B-16314]|uniref:helix-turn-helix domain-containing protein n=1 Tax=Saccharothrix sp. NRRL B-16314 TaxID=1463825 RepID=UPI001E3424EF|nr:helix-turn-helix domain-containing protein [Saccharothrix sp. NRRL B-16314]